MANKLPFLEIKDNTVIGLHKTDRKVMYENQMCKEVGLIAQCNYCDRIIFEDEHYKKQYTTNGGYCKECFADIENENN